MISNKKGFTLVELLATLTLLLLFVMILFPSIMAVSKNIKINQYKSQVEFILTAAREYGEDNINDFETGNCIKYNGNTLTVGNLIEEGYIKPDKDKTKMTDPRSDESMNDLEVCAMYVNFDDLNGKEHYKVISCFCSEEECPCQ